MLAGGTICPISSHLAAIAGILTVEPGLPDHLSYRNECSVPRYSILGLLSRIPVPYDYQFLTMITENESDGARLCPNPTH
ncbi:hypothetical protein N7468_002422 [Penicillium chermesinum]|uniref:Uncharacterized protein n=1 Tax=Penicillium chermesinum TaxID=63820 RepID=A0A9W9PIQ5_9EURO|nr:uncharacterized protein N7468_002422 [Penicillium chermesinum]KAJ5247439.1 hypothetical protein N7468_002422 [Penicillium chermesinum]